MYGLPAVDLNVGDLAAVVEDGPNGFLVGSLHKEIIVRQLKCLLEDDEVYREFCYDGLDFFSVLNLEGLEKNVGRLGMIHCCMRLSGTLRVQSE